MAMKYDQKKYDKIAYVANRRYGYFKKFQVWINGKPYGYNDPDKIIILSRNLAKYFKKHDYDLKKCIDVCTTLLHNSGHYDNYTEAKKQLWEECKKVYGEHITLKDIEDCFYIPLLVHRSIDGFIAEDYFYEYCKRMGKDIEHSPEYMDRFLHTDFLVHIDGKTYPIQVKSREWKSKSWYERDRIENDNGMKKVCKKFNSNKYFYAFYTIHEDKTITFDYETCYYKGE